MNGQDSGTVFNNQLKVLADGYVADNDLRVAYGEIKPVDNTVFDFRSMRKLGDFVNPENPVLKAYNGYDICFTLNGNGFRKVAECVGDISGIKMQVFTDMEGMQLYASIYDKGVKGKNCTYVAGNSFCLETEHYPNAVNCKNFPSPIVRKGQTFKSTTEYRIQFD
jgi:aldose 1-epimerase